MVHVVPAKPISKNARIESNNEIITQKVEKIFAPRQPNQRPPKPDIKDPNKGKNKISKYIIYN